MKILRIIRFVRVLFSIDMKIPLARRLSQCRQQKAESLRAVTAYALSGL
jgi:hypothetical protein